MIQRGNLVKLSQGKYYGIVLTAKEKTAIVFISNGLEMEILLDELEALPIADGATAPASFHEIIKPERI